MSGLAGHARYTPQDDAAVDAYATALEARLSELRQRSAALERIIAGPAAAGAQAVPTQAAAGGVTVRMDSRGKPIVDIAPGATQDGGEPIVIEDILAKPEGSMNTRTNTVIRRGDEVISVVRPLHNETRPYARSESSLEDGRY
jgi:hypothetical protein